MPDSFRAEHPGHRADFFANPAMRAMGAGRELYGRRRDGTTFPVEIGLTLSAGASLSVKGVSVSVKADADVGVEGSMAKLAGQGMTQITGGLVTIN